MLRRLAVTCYHRRRWVVAGWLLLAAGLLSLAGTSAGTFEDVFELPDAESQQAAEVLEAGGFEGQAGFQGQLVLHAEVGIDQPAIREPVLDLLAAIESDVPGVEVDDPYSQDAGHRVSADGTIGFAELSLAPRSDDAYDRAVKTIRDHVAATDLPDGRLELAGGRFMEAAEGGSEAVGLIGAVIILLVAFGSLLAMGLPIVTALFGIGTGAAIVMLLANMFTMPSFTLQLVLMLGIGVGIDYALFIVTRYREALAEDRSPEQAVTTAMTTAGRAVFFAGTTVVISVLGLLVVGLDVNRSLGIAAAAGVLMTMLAALTLLPAILGFIGHNIDRFGLPHRRKATHVSPFWARWSRAIQRRPLLPALVALGILVALTIPTASIQLGFGDAGNRPTSDTTRRAYDLLAEGFGPGSNGPLILAAATPSPTSHDHLDALVGTLGDTPGVAGTTPAIRSGDRDVAFVQVIPTSSPQDAATADLVHHLRDEVIPAAANGSDLEVYVGGAPAAAVDFADFNRDRLPIFIGAVLIVSFFVLLIVFRSVIVPLEAVILNLLSVGAAYGILVAVFQWGWGSELLGLGEPGPIEAWVPLMLFAVVFGLSMDYEVFLLSRIREEYERTRDNADAVAQGLAATARLISAAAAIMVVVFAGFVLSPDRSLQIFGLGLASAVFVDATIVRLIVVPATMELLGDRNWWLPRVLDRVLPG